MRVPRGAWVCVGAWVLGAGAGVRLAVDAWGVPVVSWVRSGSARREARGAGLAAPSVPSEEGGTPLRELSVTLPCVEADIDLVSELLLELGCASVSAELVSERPLLANSPCTWPELLTTTPWEQALVKAIVSSSFDEETLLERLRAFLPGVSLNVIGRDLPDRDWVTHVQQSWNPIAIGNLTILFPWHTPPSNPSGPMLLLEGGAAFGTGDHPTTRLCCRWVEREVSARKNAAVSVLDYGCGSGILGLAALCFGASRATGVDVDRDALSSAHRNALANRLHTQIVLFLADSDPPSPTSADAGAVAMNPLKGIGCPARSTSDGLRGETFDLVVANIFAPALIALAPSLAAYVKNHGVLALSGILKSQAPAVCEAFGTHFRNVDVRDDEGEWVLIEARGRDV